MKVFLSPITRRLGGSLYPTWFRWKGMSRKSCKRFLQGFISHMVQMKDGCSLCTQKYCWHLYIPHGSDERDCSKRYLPPRDIPLYPTWFRWKKSFFRGWKKVTSLYIPHGSDERRLDETTIRNERFLYIPHGSDERRLDETTIRNERFLYIPHGSDERTKVRLNEQETKTLYPTWFRWKLAGRLEGGVQFIFISHMVQMKAKKPDNPWKIIITLYPTWFRWKSVEDEDINWRRTLYIPHGSDER